MDLLTRFRLIYQDRDDKQIYYATQYLPKQRSNEANKIIKIIEDSLELAFYFRFPRYFPDNLMINFLSEYGPYSNTLPWQSGIYFTSENGVNCLVEQKGKNYFCKKLTLVNWGLC